MFENFVANGFIYLLIFGYPIIIILGFIINKEKEFTEMNLLRKAENIDDIIKKAKSLIKLIDSFFEKNIKNENDVRRNILLLEGNIKIHSKICNDKDCPLKKFINNKGNYNLQKQYLLSYMNIFFIKALKLY